jgi:hypothetical protein
MITIVTVFRMAEIDDEQVDEVIVVLARGSDGNKVEGIRAVK